MAEEKLTVPDQASDSSTGRNSLYANRSSRLRIANLIENSPSTARHPYVNIIRGREMESVNSFADGVVEILKLHGNIIVEYDEAGNLDSHGTKASSENIVYVVDQIKVEDLARKKGLNFPVTTSRIVSAMGPSILPGSKIILKVTTDFSRNILLSGTEDLSNDKISGVREEVKYPAGETTSVLSFYFAGVSFGASAALQVALLYTGIYGPGSIFTVLSFVPFGIIFLFLSPLAYILRLLGFKKQPFSEKIAVILSALLFVLILLIETFIPPSISGGSPLAGFSSQLYPVLSYSATDLALLALMAIEVSLFSFRRGSIAYTGLVSFASVISILSLPLLLGISFSNSNFYYGAGFAFYNVFSRSAPHISNEIALSILLIITNAIMGFSYFLIGQKILSSGKNDRSAAK